MSDDIDPVGDLRAEMEKLDRLGFSPNETRSIVAALADRLRIAKNFDAAIKSANEVWDAKHAVYRERITALETRQAADAAAVRRLAAQNERLREVLTFYADDQNYSSSDLKMCGHFGWTRSTKDAGRRAREALVANAPTAGDEVAAERGTEQASDG